MQRHGLAHFLARRRYGGRVDNVYDSMLLKTFVDHLFQPDALSADFQMNLFIRSPGGTGTARRRLADF